MSAPLSLVRDGALAIITFDRPPLNLFDGEMVAELDAAVTELEGELPRALLIRAEGRVVSGGVDVGAVFDGLDEAGAEALWSEWFETIHRLERLPVPTVFCAHALCLTAAFEVALACDLIVAARSARFGLVERVVGLTPSMGGPQRLAERAGSGRAKELIMTGALYDAETLERWNVVNRVFDDEDLHEAAVAFARDLADGPTRAHAATKAIVAATTGAGVHEADRVTPEISAALFGTDDLISGVRSFIEEGPGNARFTGR